MSYLHIQLPTKNQAKKDIDRFMEASGFKNVALRSKSHNKISFFFVKLLSVLLLTVRVKRGDILLMQYPFKKFYTLACVLTHLRGGKVVTIVHDLGCCRRKKLTEQQEVRRLSHTDVLIVHNEAMKQFLTRLGYTKPMVTLGIFDYIAPTPGSTPQKNTAETWQVVYAGGLSMRKNKFLYLADPHIQGWHLNIFGRGLNEAEAANWKNITARGFIKSDDFIKSSIGHFGLVWDGSSIDACEGEWGRYLLINNPHKTSFYLRSGKPVIMWDKAALTPFVLEHGIGIAVSSLREIGQALAAITPEQYAQMSAAALRMSRQLQEGDHFRQAFQESLQLL